MSAQMPDGAWLSSSFPDDDAHPGVQAGKRWTAEWRAVINAIACIVWTIALILMVCAPALVGYVYRSLR